ncbi:MAG: helix-turn-helix transcriptional regulator [Chloroflexota bacterium]|nr:helix-turn-helix transcriptional regulator [Chloroflexota bacterium]
MVERKLTFRDRIIGVLLRDARQRAGRTQAECADALGVSTETMEAYEEGRIPVSLPELEVLGYLLGTPIHRFWEAEPDLESGRECPDFQTLLDLRHRIVGVLLRQARLEAGMTLQESAEVLGCSQDRVSEYEHGMEPIALSELELLADRLNLSLEHFVDGQEGRVGAWHRQQEIDRHFHELPEDVQEFVAKPVNVKYLEVAMRLSQMPASRLRAIAEGLLEITY